MLWPEPNLFTRADVIHGLRYLKPAYSFRSRYAYDNTLYIVAGQVAAAAGGAPYEELMRRELFGPLGMNRCQVGEWNRDAVGNVAQPHALRDGRYVPARTDGEIVPNVPMMAAGGIRCSLDDMLTWTRMWLKPDKVGLQDGRPWLSQAQREELWKPHTIMPLSRRMRDWDNSHYSAYGYGWRLTDVDGTWKVSHTGTLGGMYSALTLLPQKHAGFVILINGDADEARTVLTRCWSGISPRRDRTRAWPITRIAWTRSRRAPRKRSRCRIPPVGSRPRRPSLPAGPASIAIRGSARFRSARGRARWCGHRRSRRRWWAR
jgi:CubicO group peptidase (beta-lactamase class C family)